MSAVRQCPHVGSASRSPRRLDASATILRTQAQTAPRGANRRRPAERRARGPAREVSDEMLLDPVRATRLSIERGLSLTRPTASWPVAPWGLADFRYDLGDCSLVLEIETRQHHPNTDVLNYWPWLEDNQSARLFLLHVFQSTAPANSSRQRLAEWLARRMELDLRGAISVLQTEKQRVTEYGPRARGHRPR